MGTWGPRVPFSPPSGLAINAATLTVPQILQKGGLSELGAEPYCWSFCWLSRWWQLKYCLFSPPLTWGK